MTDMTNFQIDPMPATPVEQLQFKPLDSRYRQAYMMGMLLIYVLLAVLAALLFLTGRTWVFLLAECAVAVAAIVNLSVLPKALRFKGYAFREHDLSFRSGIFFPKLTTVPYVRIQQISVSRNPLSQLFGLCSLDVVNGAQQFAALRIPGLTEEDADRIKTFLTEKINARND